MKDGENETQETTPETVTPAAETVTPAAETVTPTPETITPPAPVETVTPETVTPAAVVTPDGFIARTEFDAAVARAEAAEARAEAAEARATEQATNARNAAIDQAATELGFHDAEDARRLVDADATDYKAALAEVLKTKSFLAKSATPIVTPIDAANPPRNETLSLEAMRGMTPAQLASNWQAVKAALKLSAG